jgi:hypothetical protein
MGRRPAAGLVPALILGLASGACTPTVTEPTTAPGGSAAAGGSGAPTVSATPTGPVGPWVKGRDWGAASVVEPPAGNPNATTTPYVNPGSLGHPQHYQGGQADLLDVASDGGLMVAVGYLARDFSAAMWWSHDGNTWTLARDIPSGEGSVASGVAIGSSGVVAVGGDGPDAAVWRSTDGRTWRRITSGSFHDSTQIRMTAVVARAGGFVAGGYVGTLAGPIRAAFWTSANGETWDRVADDESFEGTRVTGLAISPDGSRIVAVGAVGDAQHLTDATTWQSGDGLSWHRASDEPALHDGLMNSVTAGPDGFVAVGSDVRSVRAIAWSTSDGLTWAQAPDAPALDNFGLKVEMRDVTWTGEGFLAGGHYLFGTQFPAGALWTSPDGIAWARAPDAAALSQGKIQGVSSGDGRLVAVGSFGSPDFSIPSVWLSPPN